MLQKSLKRSRLSHIGEWKFAKAGSQGKTGHDYASEFEFITKSQVRWYYGNAFSLFLLCRREWTTYQITSLSDTHTQWFSISPRLSCVLQKSISCLVKQLAKSSSWIILQFRWWSTRHYKRYLWLHIEEKAGGLVRTFQIVQFLAHL